MTARSFWQALMSSPGATLRKGFVLPGEVSRGIGQLDSSIDDHLRSIGRPDLIDVPPAVKASWLERLPHRTLGADIQAYADDVDRYLASPQAKALSQESMNNMKAQMAEINSTADNIELIANNIDALRQGGLPPKFEGGSATSGVPQRGYFSSLYQGQEAPPSVVSVAQPSLRSAPSTTGYSPVAESRFPALDDPWLDEPDLQQSMLNAGGKTRATSPTSANPLPFTPTEYEGLQQEFIREFAKNESAQGKMRGSTNPEQQVYNRLMDGDKQVESAFQQFVSDRQQGRTAAPKPQANDLRKLANGQAQSQRTIGEIGQGLYEGAKSALSFLPQSFDPERTGKTAVQLALGALATRLVGAPLAGTVLNAEQEAAIAGLPFGEMLTGYQPIERNAEALAIRGQREAEEEAMRLRNRQREEAMYAMQMRRAAMYDQLGAQALGSLMANYAGQMGNSNSFIQGYLR